MNKSIAILIMAFTGWLIFPTTLYASEIDLSKPVTLKPDTGDVVFSITIRGDVQFISFIKWRAVDGDKLRDGDGRSGEIGIRQTGGLFNFAGNEELSKTPRHVFGRLVGLALPAGTYEFYGFHTRGGYDFQTMLFNRWKFSRRFTVVPGKIQYIGNLDIYEKPDPVFVSKGTTLLTGIFYGDIEIFPSLLDAGDADMPLLVSKNNGLSTADIERNITDNETDNHMEILVNSLRDKSEQGDIAAKRRLLIGLLNGWGVSESGEEFKVSENRKLQQQLGEQLFAQGISGGAYALGQPQLSALKEKSKKSSHADAEGQQVLGYLLTDARHYFKSSMESVAWVYDNGLPGVATQSGSANLWEDRLEAMEKLPTKFVPYLNEAGRAEFRKFIDASSSINPKHRYFALSVSGAFGLSTGNNSTARTAIAACEARNNGAMEHCRLYAQDDRVVWDACPAEYAGPQATTFPPVTRLRKLGKNLLPPDNLNDAGKASYQDFLAAPMPRAFAISDSGETGMASGDCHAAYRALQICREHLGKACQLYAMDDQVVLGATDPELVEEQQRLAVLVEKAATPTAEGNTALPGDGELTWQ